MFLGFGCLALVLRLNADPGAPLTLDQAAGAAAFGCLYALPGMLALASGGRGSLLVASGLVGLCLIPTSFSITPLLIVPSILVLVGAGRSPDLAPIRTLIVTAIVVGAGVGAFVLLLTGSQTFCWSTGAGGTMTGVAGQGTGTLPPGEESRSGVPIPQSSAPASSGGSGGCDGGAVPPVHAAAAVALTVGGVVSALLVGRRRPPTPATVPWRPPGPSARPSA